MFAPPSAARPKSVGRMPTDMSDSESVGTSSSLGTVGTEGDVSDAVLTKKLGIGLVTGFFGKLSTLAKTQQDDETTAETSAPANDKPQTPVETDQQLIDSLPAAFFEASSGFDPAEHVLMRVAGEDFLMESLEDEMRRNDRCLDVVNARLCKQVIRNSDAFVQGMAQIQTLETDLVMTTVLCRNGRRSLQRAQLDLTSGGLHILSQYRRKNKYLDLIQLLTTIRTLKERSRGLEHSIEREDFLSAVRHTIALSALSLATEHHQPTLQIAPTPPPPPSVSTPAPPPAPTPTPTIATTPATVSTPTTSSSLPSLPSMPSMPSMLNAFKRQQQQQQQQPQQQQQQVAVPAPTAPPVVAGSGINNATPTVPLHDIVCVQKMWDSSSVLIEDLPRRLISRLENVLSSFSVSEYDVLVRCFVHLGLVDTLLATIRRKFHTLAQLEGARAVADYVRSISPNAKVPESLLQSPQDLMKQLAVHITEEHVTPCLVSLFVALANILRSFATIVSCHVNLISRALANDNSRDGDESPSSTPPSSPLQSSDRLSVTSKRALWANERERQNILSLRGAAQTGLLQMRAGVWEGVQAPVSAYIHAIKLPAFKVDGYLTFLNTVNSFVAFGDQFTHATHKTDASVLVGIVAGKSADTFRNWHKDNMDLLTVVVENEVWSQCPLAATFKFRDLKEMRKERTSTLQQSRSFTHSAPTHSSAQGDRVSDGGMAEFLRKFENLGQPWDDSQDTFALNNTPNNNNTTTKNINSSNNNNNAHDQLGNASEPELDIHGPVATTGASLNVVKFMGRYTQIMEAIPVIADRCFESMQQITWLYVNSVFTVFVADDGALASPTTDISAPSPSALSHDLSKVSQSMKKGVGRVMTEMATSYQKINTKTHSLLERSTTPTVGGVGSNAGMGMGMGMGGSSAGLGPGMGGSAQALGQQASLRMDSMAGVSQEGMFGSYDFLTLPPPVEVLRQLNASFSLSDIPPVPHIAESCIAAESMCFIADAVRFITPRINTIVSQVGLHISGNSSNTSSSLAQQTSSGSFGCSVSPRVFEERVSRCCDAVANAVYCCLAARLLNMQHHCANVLTVKWDEVKEMNLETNNRYVESILADFKIVKHRLASVTVPSHCLRKIWQHVINHVMECLVDAYSRIKKCSTGGRALMSLDLQMLRSGVKTILTGIPELSSTEGPIGGQWLYVDNYIKAHYLVEKEVLDWVQKHPEYRLKHVHALINNLPINLKKKARSDLLTRATSIHNESAPSFRGTPTPVVYTTSTFPEADGETNDGNGFGNGQTVAEEAAKMPADDSTAETPST